MHLPSGPAQDVNDGCLDGPCVSHRDEGAAQPGSRPSQPQYHCPDRTARQLRDLVIRKLLEFAQENDFSEVEGQLSDCRLYVVSILPAHENLMRIPDTHRSRSSSSSSRTLHLTGRENINSVSELFGKNLPRIEAVISLAKDRLNCASLFGSSGTRIAELTKLRRKQIRQTK
jgi:hypothetical protein